MTSSANEHDPRVTQAYRDLATERTPPALDEKVLATATTTARTPYGRTRGWLRPLAWTATIALSLAVVLEIARFADEPVLPASTAGNSGVEEQALMRAGEKREAAASARAASFAAQRLPPQACDDAQRASPETWHACVESLREEGLAEAADRELEALREAFPDFAVPNPE